jgi:hypothetical protein
MPRDRDTDRTNEKLSRNLTRHSLIDKSGIRRVWTPHQPVSSVDLFAGRLNEIDAIVGALQTPGQHAILFGDPGVGKSSLAIYTKLMMEMAFDKKVHLVRCDSTTTFASLVESIFLDLGIGTESPATSKATKARTGGKLGIAGVGLDGGIEVTTTESRPASALRLGPSSVCRALQGKSGVSGVVIVDEFDAVSAKEDRRSVAELIKQVSDAAVPIKFLVVGIGASTEDLLAGHTSVHRNLKEVHLERMSNLELLTLIQTNTGKTGMAFAPQVASEIALLSDGFPYFAQLLGLKCAELAVVASRKNVFAADVPRALRAAAEDAEQTLRKGHREAIRSQDSRMYEWILEAIAAADTIEVSTRTIRERVTAAAGRQVKQHEINNCFHRLVKVGNPILKRVSRGIYRFSDPRMKVYVRILARVSAAG